MKKELLLKKYFGYSSFLPGQKELVDHICMGEDALGIMPTGGGKSLCYQMSAMVFEGITLVISPLISLMKDQVRALVDGNIPAAYINSSLTEAQTRTALRNARDGKYKLIYIAPERLDAYGFSAMAREMNISMVAVDEAHCVSQWGHNFRSSYVRIKSFIEALPVRPVLTAFTATATSQVKDDIIALLGLRNPFIKVTGFDRPNLFFDVRKPEDKFTELLSYVRSNQDKSGIVYCSTRKNVEQVCEFLREKGLGATRYHAGLTLEERSANQEDFLFDRKTVMVATNAFGMGIDKSNVSYVIHFNMPKDMEGYYQEAGRAGRDGMDADCLLFFSRQDVMTAEYLIESCGYDGEIDMETREQLKAHDRLRLRKMVQYCDTTDCLRQYLLDYFGEKTGGCGRCGNCLADTVDVDVTAQAQLILSGLNAMKQPCGVTLLIDTLLGKKSERIKGLKLDHTKPFGKLKGESPEFLRSVISLMIATGYIALTEDRYPILKQTNKSSEVLSGGEKVTIRLRQSDVPQNASEKKTKDKGTDKKLLGELKELRLSIAREKGVPAFVVFSDATLADMCRKLPSSREEFLRVSGVGQAKLEQYGDIFIRKIKTYRV